MVKCYYQSFTCPLFVCGHAVINCLFWCTSPVPSGELILNIYLVSEECLVVMVPEKLTKCYLIDV